ncbi:DNA topoisomerase (ATP-hydrolyzing) subunit B [uncultured Oscillibacter sp.]|uniref:DNA topoisomerase (ATP-hydrolyzing) subunit B n=1 Tax=uncultured Oscillibacter sp. TaxID=876091 RepID=UPI0025EDAB4D|nr:DNA topoisomerase (ATP-hydrolyzing) subunit B [uncultured Oscillibacter sp.]
MAENEILNSTAVDASNEYDASEIQVLEGLEAVRKRPGMYIGSTSESGLHHLVYEIVDNAIDEALAGYCDEITVTINPGDTITVTDNGRGIPVDIQAQTGKPALEVVFTILHAGGKFGGGGYKVSGGLHGVGASVVNALSEWLAVQVHKDGKIHEMKFSRGHVTQEMTVVGTTDRTGTTVSFKPDPEMFEETVYRYDTLHTRMREEAFLNAGLRIRTVDKRQGREQEDSMCYEGGIREFVTWLNKSKDALHNGVIYMAGQKDDSMAEVALQYNDGYNETILSFANNVHTPEGGMHEEGFKRALTTVLNNYGRKIKMLKEDEKVSGEDCREGLTCVISVKLTEAQFEGQTKAKLGNSEIRTLVNNIVSDKLDTFLEENPQVGRMILDKALTANRAREAAKKARESIRRKTALGGAAMPDKLRDCNENNPELTEIYIVEGDSAGGSATQGRDSRFQAILPLWGKMLNVEKARADKVYGNDKLQPVITALGAGIGEEFDAGKLRYHKVIIMADADVDGAHIRTLLLTFFFRFMRPLIEQGYVYSAVPPLFKLSRGKTTRLAFSEEERDAISAELRGDNPNAKVDISRFKGLGEMNPHELWETTMDPEKRTLRRITLDDAVRADEIFTILMGEKVEPRKAFIEENAQYAVNLDY